MKLSKYQLNELNRILSIFKTLKNKEMVKDYFFSSFEHNENGEIEIEFILESDPIVEPMLEDLKRFKL